MASTRVQRQSYEKNCEACAESFTAARAHARYCSKACGKSGWEWEHGRSLPAALVCVVCGGSLEHKKSSAIYCSRKCANVVAHELRRGTDKRRDEVQQRQAQLRGVAVEAVCRRVVFERDEGVCGICNTPVDPANFHLDHVIPLVAGGEHSYANVQVAHPFCNMSKGARHS